MSLRWSEPFASTKNARDEAKRRVEAGEGTLAFVVHVDTDGRRRVIGIYPRSAERVIDHYRDLLAALEKQS